MTTDNRQASAPVLKIPGNTYDHPSLEVHPPAVVIRRRGFENFEEVVPAFVKISTAFKEELQDIDGVALKVWIFLALSINRNTEQAHPGIRTIAQACGIGQNTAIAAIHELEQHQLLVVNREDRKYNIYEIPAYASANARTASKMEADDRTASEDLQTASEKPQTASENSQTASVSRRLNQITRSNQNEPEINNSSNKTLAAISILYESEIGMLTPMIADFLRDAAKDYPAGWVEDAIQAAARRNARNWSYIETILKRWKKDGKNTQFQLGGHRKKTPNVAPEAKRYIEGEFAEFIQH